MGRRWCKGGRSFWGPVGKVLADVPPILLGCMLFVRFRPVHLFQDSVCCGEGDYGSHDHGSDHAGPREIPRDNDGHDERTREGGEDDGIDGEVDHGGPF